MCGKCICEPGYSGDACECLDKPSNCIDPVTNKTCNDQGRCPCGECECVAPYYGKFCDQCPVRTIQSCSSVSI